MGQKVGKCKYVDVAQPFTNLPQTAMTELWEAFNDIAEGFGLTCGEFQDIILVLQDYLEMKKPDLEAIAKEIFDAIDTDKNELIDALEFLGTFALASGMDIEDKILFVFNCYDFDESGELTIDEMTLSMKSTLTGLAKITDIKTPKELELEAISQQAFLQADKNKDSKISRNEFLNYCKRTPEVRTWLAYFDDPLDNAISQTIVDSDIEREGKIVDRKREMICARNLEQSIDAVFQYEAESLDPKFTVVKPWMGNIVDPTELPKDNPGQPDSNLELEWVHGYRSADVRNNLRYSDKGEVVYHAGAVGVVYSPADHTQRFNLDHSDEILCMCIHPSGEIVATGEAGPMPRIIVWDINTGKSLVSLSGHHRRAVTHLSFSPDGELLTSVGGDEDHSVCVYNWNSQTTKKIFAEKNTREKVLDVCFRDNTTFVTCGVDHIYFWRRNGKSNIFEKKKGLFGKKGKLQPICCASPTPDGKFLITGTASGHLYTWASRNCKGASKAHDRNVNCLFTFSAGIVSGGKDGKVRLWRYTSGGKISAGASFDISSLLSYSPQVKSICVDQASTKLLVGTQGSEIYEISMADGSSLHDGPLVQGHFKNELWGIAVNPIKVSEYATVGDDSTVRVWDFATRKLIKKTKIECPGRAIAYSPNGKSIVVGLGTENSQNEKLCGGFVILNETDLTVIHEARDSKKLISDIKFTASGSIMAVASHDNNIYLYNAEDGEYSARGKCRGHSAPVTHIDFSEDGKWLQSNAADFSLMYWDTEDGEQKKSAHALKDVDWGSWTCTYGWPVQGIWPSFKDGLDYSAVHRSYSGKVLACSDTFGRVTIRNYPSVKKGSGSKLYFGHSSRCTNVRFSVDDRYVVTTGASDHCIFQWKHIVDGFEEEAEKFDIDADSEDEIDAVQGDNLDRNPDLEDANKLDMFQLFTFEEGKAGDDAVAVKPWWGSVVAPTAPPRENFTQTNHEMNLEWVYGYRSQGSRNNVRYLASGEITYPAAKLGITLNKDTWVQRYNTEHTDEVISLAVHPEGRFVATGQLGKKPSIVIWDANTMETVVILTGCHRRGVSQLAFSADGKYLASVGEDTDHAMVVYSWRDGRIESFTKCGTNKILDLQWSPDGKSIVQSGVDHIKFHTLHGRNITTLKGVIGKKGRIQNIISIGWVKQDKKDVCVTGCQDGHLYVWEGRKLNKPIKAHERNITAIHSVPEGICTGGKDGKIKLWNNELECIQEFDIVELDIALAPRIRSVCWHPGANKILVGTRSAEIFELSAADGSDINHGPLIQGHYYDESWGLAIHPAKPEFATVGDDMTLRIFDMASRKLMRRQKLGCLARAVAYSPDGGKIAIGYGGKVGQGKNKKDGSYIILRESSLEVLHEARDSKQWITDIKFTPDGCTLGVASYDNCVYLYDVPNGFSLKAKFDRHNSFITHFDFSLDSQYMMTNCGAFELLFSDATNGALIPAPSSLKDTDWATQNCVLSWATQGTWPAYADGTEITSTDRSANGELLASGDDFGRVRLWRWPAISQTAGYKSFPAHASGIRRMQFTPGDNFLLTQGGADRCTLQWKIDMFDDVEEGIEAGDSGNDTALEIGNGMEETETDQFMAVRPWVGSIVPPTDKPLETIAPPSIKLELDYVQGYRSYDTRNNVRYNDAGEIIYHTSTLGIIYNKPQHAQKFFRDHKMNILSLAIDPSGKYVATGEQSKRPFIRIWDSQTGSEIACLREFHRRGIPCLEFSANGKNLVSVGNDLDHEIAVWSTASGEWYDGRLLAHEKSGREKVLFCSFIRTSTRFHIMTGGVKAVKFWRLQSGTLRPKPGVFGRKGKLQPILCAANIGDHLVTGTVSGHLYVWRVDSRTIVKAVKAHDKTINTIYARKTALAEFLVTGGKDGVVKLWSVDLECLQTFNVAEIVPPSFNPSVRSVCIDANGNTLLIGTHGAEIYEISNGTGTTLITQAHCAMELWGLAMHPTDSNIYATCGDDKSIRIWDLSRRKMIKMATLDSMSRCIAWHPNGTMLAAGLGGAGGRGKQKKDGAFVVIDYETMNIRHEARDSREWISEIKFSPDGNTLGLGSHDNKIYLYDVSNDFALKAKCEKHASYITHFDFSADNGYIQSNCGAYELFFFSAGDGSHIVSPSLLKDTEWATWTVPLGWPVQGIWPVEADGTEITAVDRDKTKSMLATVDEQGRLIVRKYPALSKKAEFVLQYGHASHITNVRFNADDKYLVTVGGGDRAIITWKVIKIEEAKEKKPVLLS